MSTNLDKSLDDIINENKKSGSGNSRGGGGRGRSGPGPTRRFPNRAASRAGPYIPAKAPDTTWQHDLFTDQAIAVFPAQAGRASAIETGTKLYISNLDYGVSNEDIKELFSEVGDLKRYGVHYDRSGRSKGTAEVVYSRRQDAISALKRYNNVQLDGKPMKIEIVGTNMAAPAAAAAAAAVAAAAAPLPPVLNGVGFGNSNGVPRGGRGRGGAMGRPRGGGRGFGRGRGRGRGRGEKISAEDLDADLEKYHSESMETN